MLEDLTDAQLREYHLLRYRRGGETHLIHWMTGNDVHGYRLYDDQADEVAAKIEYAADPDELWRTLNDWLIDIHEEFIGWVEEEAQEE